MRSLPLFPPPATRLATALTTALAVTGSLLLPIAAAASAPGAPSTDVDSLAQARWTGQQVEVTSATSPTDMLTANPNGSLTLKRHLVPVRKRVDGIWRNLDATLRFNADGSVSPALTDSELSFSSGGKGPAATMKQAGKKLALTLPLTLPKPVLSGATATYHNVMPDVDLQLTATSQGAFSQVFIVHNAGAATNPALRSILMSVAAEGLSVSSDSHNTLQAIDTLGQPVFAAPTPMMWDSAKALKAMGVKVTGNTIALTADPSLLTADAAYPVYLDPSWTPVKPTMGGNRNGYASVAKAFPTSSKWNSTADPNPDRLQVSWNDDGWHARTMVNFGIDVGILATASISSAILDVTSPYSGACRTAATRVFAPATTLKSTNATWDYWYSSVSLGSVIDTKSFYGGYSSSCSSPASVGFNVLAGVNGAVTAGRSTQTFVFTGPSSETSDTANYKEFSLASLALTITYNRTPSTPANLTTSPQTSCTGTVDTVGDGEVRLYAPVSDPDGRPVGVRYEVWKSSVPGTLIKSTDPANYSLNSGSIAVLSLDQPLLKAQSGTSITEFSWRVQVWDGFATSGWSATCKFKFDPTRPGAPGATAPAENTTHIGQPVTIAVTKPVSGTAPASYLYQLNAGIPGTVPADPTDGQASINIIPTRRTNTLTITAVSAGGNIGIDSAVITFTTAPLAPGAEAADADLTGDSTADLLTVGNTNNLPSGVWLAAGRNTQVATNAFNIGVNGNGVVGDSRPSNFDGAQVITGSFVGTGLQDVLAYYPNTGRGSIIAGNGDGSALLPQFAENQFNINNTELKDEGTWPLQIANAGDTIANGDRTADLIGIGGIAGAYHLNYYFYASIQNSQGIIPFTTKTPALDMNWNEWKIATAQVGGKTSMFLWHPATGALHLWRNLDMSTGDLTYQPFQLRAADWNTGVSLTLRAADVNTDGIADLWTVGTNRTVVAHLTSGLTGTSGTTTPATTQNLATMTHNWTLSDKPGTANPGDVIAAAADNVPAGATARPLAGTAGATWHTGDLFSPDAQLDGTSAMLATNAPAVTTNADFSVSAWVKPTTTSGTVLSQDGTNTAGFQLYADSTTKSWQFGISRTDTAAPVWDTAAAPANSVQIGVWTQLTASYNATSGMMNLAVNGTTVATATHTIKWNATGAFRAGAAKTSSSPAYSAYFTGQLANIQTWNEVLDLTGASRSLMGDARADIIRKANGSLLGYFNGGITGTKSVNWDNAPGGYTIGTGFAVPDSATYFADLNADGYRDLIRKSANGEIHTKYNPGTPLNNTATWIDSSPWYLIGTGFTVLDSAIYFADLNADRRADIIKKINGNLEAYYNLGVNASNGINWDQAGPTNGHPIGSSWTMADSSIYFADLNADRRADIIRKHTDGKLGAYYNGGINASKGVNWDYASGGYQIGSSWTMPDNTIYFADLTGEGRADIIRKDGAPMTAYYNSGVNTSKGITWDYGTGGYAITSDWSSIPPSSLYIG